MWPEPYVILCAFVAYATILSGVMVADLVAARRTSRGLNKAGPGGHIGHKRGAKALILQMPGRDG